MGALTSAFKRSNGMKASDDPSELGPEDFLSLVVHDSTPQVFDGRKNASLYKQINSVSSLAVMSSKH